MASFSVTKSDKTATFTATGSFWHVYWKFGDGSQGVGTSTSHTYASYGTYSILVDYREQGDSIDRSSVLSVTLTDPALDDPDELDGNIITDAFKAKPVIIPAECTGNIRVTAIIEDLEKPNIEYDPSQGRTIEPYINFASILVPGSSSLTFILDKDTTTSTSFDGVESVTDAKMENLGNIPAFYDTGLVNLEFKVSETEDADSNVDLKWEVFMDFPEAQSLCPWSEGNYVTDSQIMKNLITSSNSETKDPYMTDYTNYTRSFAIQKWSQIPPFVIKEFVDEPATTTMVKRAMLADPRIHLRVTNNLSSDVTLSYTLCIIKFSYNSTNIFMNMRTEGDRRQKQSRIYTLPKGAEVTRLDSLDFPIYAVVDGYKVGTSTRAAEIVKVYATWNEYYEEGDYYFPTTIELLPVEGMSGTDYSTCLYKSVEGVMKRADFIRVTDGGWMNGDGITVLDAPTIAASEHYRTINVKVQSPSGYDGYNPDAQDAMFIIDTAPNTNVDDAIDEDTLAANIDKVHFFNVTKPFASSVSINRSEIEPTFYETLWQTYDKAVVLESVVEEPLYYVKFSVNNYPKTIPIYNNNTVMFSDSLSHAADGVRSGDVWIMDGVTPNIINIQCPTKHKYKVKFLVKYDVYKHMYVITDEDIPAGYL